MDAADLGFYHHMVNERGIPDLIITSPYFSLLDLALPLAAAFARKAVFIHCPCWYFSDATDGRFRFLREFARTDRLFVIFGLPRGPVGRRCLWLCLFRDDAAKRDMLKPGWLVVPAAYSHPHLFT